MCSPNTYACKGVFNPNIPIFMPKSAEGFHFSAFHIMQLTLMSFNVASGVIFPPFCGVNVHDSMANGIDFAET